MKKIFIYLVCSVLLYGCENRQLIPGFDNSDVCYFYNANRDDLLENIKTHITNIEDRTGIVIDTSVYKLKIYVDNRLIPLNADYFLEIRKGDVGSYCLMFIAPYETKYYNDKFSTNHSIKYEFYCPHIFGDEEYHTVLINCNMQNYFFKNKVYSLDGKAGNKLDDNMAEFTLE